MIARRTPLAALLLTVLSTSYGVISAHGTAIDWLVAESGVVLLRDPGSTRLDGMGGLKTVIPDEGQELNLSDYGGNLSGVLSDSDGRRWESWIRSESWKSDLYNAGGERNRTRGEVLEAGGRISWRMEDRRLIGLDYAFDQFDRDVQSGNDSKIRGPWWGGFIGQRLGRFVVTGGIHFTADNEDIHTENVFAIRHFSSGIRYTGALSYSAGPLEIGVQAERQTNTISGVSRDESRFHEDKLTWKRPVQVYGGTIIWKPLEGVTGAVRSRLVRIDGRQEVKISWSDRMPDNPGGENYLARAGTFDEEVRAFDLGTRWEAHPLEPLLLAGELEMARGETRIDEGYPYKGSRRAQDSRERVTRAIGGVGYELVEGRMRIGIEGSWLRHVHEETLLDGEVEVTSRMLELRSGIEWFATDRIAVRGGYSRIVRDDDLDAPRTLGIGQRVTFGLGYFPHGGLYQIDAGIRIQDLEPDYDGDPHLEESSLGFSLAARLLL